MTTVLTQHIRRLMVAAICLPLIVMTSCGLQPCQEAVTEPFRTFTEQEWRLVETQPPIDSTLSNTNFLIFRFGRNFAGEVYRVENNDRFDTPVLFFDYNVDAETKVIVTRFQSQTFSGGGDDEPVQNDAGDARYSYKLGRDFELYDETRGIYYRFVPFTGVVDPDSVCQF